MIAMMQNIQRMRAAGGIRGKFKPKLAHEKRIFKLKAKPKKD